MSPRTIVTESMDDRADNSQDMPEAKRRKVRKGTRSCWECRRRKEKCTFQLSTDTICIRCRRRGAKCVGQEFPEEISASLDKNIHTGDRVARVEALVKQLWKSRCDDLDTPGSSIPEGEEGEAIHDILTPSSTLLESSRVLSASRPSAVSGLS